MASFCGHCSELSDYINGGQFFDQLSDYKLAMKDSVA
jgi:hypothetical protein